MTQSRSRGDEGQGEVMSKRRCDLISVTAACLLCEESKKFKKLKWKR